MKRFTSTFFLPCLFTASLLAAPPALTLPEKVTGKPGAFITIPAQTPGKNVSWQVVDPGLNLFPPELLKDSKTAVVVAEKPGTYRLFAVTALADEVSAIVVCQVAVGDTPGPDPPPPPLPADPLTEILQRAYFADPDGQKATRIKDLSTLYRQASTVAADPALKTTTDVLTVLQKARAVLMPEDALPFVRKAIAEELNKTLATPKPLDATARAELSKQFQRIAAILEKVK